MGKPPPIRQQQTPAAEPNAFFAKAAQVSNKRITFLLFERKTHPTGASEREDIPRTSPPSLFFNLWAYLSSRHEERLRPLLEETLFDEEEVVAARVHRAPSPRALCPLFPQHVCISTRPPSTCQALAGESLPTDASGS